MNLNNGKHTITFKENKLFLDDIQIAGEGIYPPKNVILEFFINKPELKKEDPSILEVNVNDSINIQALGPGQV